MSRSGYTDDCDGWALIRWRGAVTAAIRGARGQALLREMVAALDAMPEKELYPHELEADGQYCALGVVGKQRGISLSSLDPEDRDAVAAAFGVAPALVAEIVFENDDEFAWKRDEAPAARWLRMRTWIASLITEAAS